MILELVGGIEKNTWRGMIKTIMPKHHLYVSFVMMAAAPSHSTCLLYMFWELCDPECFFSSLWAQLCHSWINTSSCWFLYLTYRGGKITTHLLNQDHGINPIFKCVECSYMAISRTVLKCRTTMKHPNKEEPLTWQNIKLFRLNIYRRFCFKKVNFLCYY